MRDYEKEFTDRVAFIRQLLAESGAAGIVYGNSGGKDSPLVGILCKMACENTEGIILPCSSKRNFTIDKDDGMEVADQFGIKTRVLDLTAQKELAMETLGTVTTLTDAAVSNLAPRLRPVRTAWWRAPAMPVSTTWATSPSGGMGPMTSIPSPT